MSSPTQSQWFLRSSSGKGFSRTSSTIIHVYHTQREGLSVGQRPVEERTGRLDTANGQELNVANAQIRTLLDRQKEQILAECQAEIKKHEFQAD